MPTGVYERTEEHKRKTRKTLMGHKHSEETKRRIGEAHKGKRHSEEAKKKMSEANEREKNNNWKGGFTYHSNGYILFKVPKGCRFSSMADHHGYVAIHRLTMAAYLQRPLKSEEVVHHINGIKDDNGIKNLMLFENDDEHTAYHYKLRKKDKEGKLIRRGITLC